MSVHVLFVSNNFYELDYLRSVMWSKSWISGFVLGAEAALTILQEVTFDVIVIDMEKNQVEEIEFLAIIRKSFPATSRIILLGSPKLEEIRQAGLVAHAFLKKPFKVWDLQQSIERVGSIRKQQVRKRVSI